MKIASPELDKIIIELTPDDMRELDIKYEDMDYSSADTRRAFRSLLERAGRELGRSIDPAGRMMIETVPEVCGGCLVCFTMLEAPRHMPADTGGELVAQFITADCLLDAAGAFSRLKIVPGHSELYADGGRYRLIIGLESEGERIKSFFAEFADFCSADALLAAETREHWQRAGGTGIF